MIYLHFVELLILQHELVFGRFIITNIKLSSVSINLKKKHI